MPKKVKGNEAAPVRGQAAHAHRREPAYCIFCRSSKRRLPHSRSTRTNTSWRSWTAIHPYRGTRLIIPKRHFESLYTMPDGLLARIIKLSKRVADAQRRVLHAEGANLVNSAGKAAWQNVPHFHMHVIPRFEDDELSGRPWWLPQKMLAVRLDGVSKKLERAIK